MHPIPDKLHQHYSGRLGALLFERHEQINVLGCQVGLGFCYFEFADSAGENVILKGQCDVCPDASVIYSDYWDTDRLPPALLVIEVLFVSDQEQIDRDIIVKPEIYAALKIPAYWIVDHRDESVWVHIKPSEGGYVSRQQFKGDAVLPAPGLEFLQITPAQIFED